MPVSDGQIIAVITVFCKEKLFKFLVFFIIKKVVFKAIYSIECRG
jgi:hypothetical protein